MKTALVFFVFAAFSCLSTRHTISMKNESHERFDSIVLHINDYKFKLGSLDTAQIVQIAFPADSLITMHDVIYHFQAYRNDTVKAESYRVLGDYGHLPKRVEATINDTLAFVYKIDW
jgi:hypothetical protein